MKVDGFWGEMEISPVFWPDGTVREYKDEDGRTIFPEDLERDKDWKNLMK